MRNAVRDTCHKKHLKHMWKKCTKHNLQNISVKVPSPKCGSSAHTHIRLLAICNTICHGPRDLGKYKASEWLLDKLAIRWSFCFSKICLKFWRSQTWSQKNCAFFANVFWCNISSGNCFHKRDIWQVSTRAGNDH